MRFIKSKYIWLGCLLIIGTAGAIAAQESDRSLVVAPPIYMDANSSKASMSRGGYLAKIGDCTSCHTAPGHKPYAGGLAINAPFGTIYSSNITPDKEYGIGGYTLKDFTRALREGIAKNGAHLYPAMPYPSYAVVSDEDITALYNFFMQEVAPVHENPPATKAIFPMNQRWGLAFWNAIFVTEKRFKPDPMHDQEWNRGAYLVSGLGHCGACHTPRGLAYEEEGSHQSSRFLSGQMLDNWYAVNLRGNNATGLGRWSEEDIAQFLKTGHGSGTAAFGNMAQVVENSTQYMTDEDLNAIAHYLKSLPADKAEEPYKPDLLKPNFDTNALPGAGFYASSCASCHGIDGSGQSPGIPKLAGNASILAADPTSLIRLMLEGGSLPHTQNSNISEKMPEFSDKLTDDEIAHTLTYIRRNWGNHAPAVTGSEVSAVRKELKQ